MKAILVLGIYLVGLAVMAADPGNQGPPAHAFFAFDNGVGRGQWLPPQQARVLKELGYDGISYNETIDITNRLEAFRAAGLKLFALYIHGFMDKPVRYEPGLTNAIRLLKGTDTMIWLTIREMPGQHDAEAAILVREVADLAGESGLRVALYPHIGFYVATAEDALRIADLAGRTNVGVSVNLCHELMAGNGDRLESIVKACAPRLFLVSINGADHGTSIEQTIKVLDDGDYDVRGFVSMLDRVGYKGPIGLQCYNLKGDPEANLKRSIMVWRRWGEGKTATSQDLQKGQGKVKVKVFILAGQSNMEGKAPNTLLDHQAEDPRTKDLFEHLRRDGKWFVRDDVFIKYLDRKGPLTIGYGSPGRTGVELEFGTMMGDHFDEPVLLIKAAWGGHSLVKLFRSPSAGYPADLQKELKQAQDRVQKNNEKEKKNNPLPTMDDLKQEYGSSYRKMLAEVKETFGCYETMFPPLKGKQLELAGFVWFQGWNDQYGGAEKGYASNLKHFINDVRHDLNAPNLPFV
ncbi:MAG: TIM barrel protein, partial [Planctomycetota bacterium]|nr:TIM barrel protein [Planctomycetota bacterium]